MCLNPRTIVVPDLYKGRKVVTVPCGHCLACLKRKQDDTTIRIIEESKNWPRLVFFTLTYSESALHRKSVEPSEYFHIYEAGEADPETGDVPIEFFDELSPASRAFLKKSDGVFGEVCAKDFSDELKRFRESYVVSESKRLSIRRKDVERLNFKYFYTTEYGPRTLRPHGHGIIWFDFDKRIIKRLFNAWRKRFGYVNYTILDTPSLSAKDTQCIARYVGKYCSKGVFESPLVQDGVAAKCTKLYSKGIGVSYVDKKRDWHLGIDSDILPAMAYFLGSMQIPQNRPSKYGGYKLFHYGLDCFTKVAARYAQCIGSAQAVEPKFREGPAKALLERYHYTMVCQDKVLHYALPRYYKNKIYGEKSLLSLSLRLAVAASLCEDYRRKFQAYKDAHPNLTDFQILAALYRQDRFAAESRFADWYDRTLKHYSKSKL